MTDELDNKKAKKAKKATTIPKFDDLPDSAFVREFQLVRNPSHPELPALLHFSPATLWRQVRSGAFPAPVKLSARVTAWKVGEVRAWISARAPSRTVH